MQRGTTSPMSILNNVLTVDDNSYEPGLVLPTTTTHKYPQRAMIENGAEMNSCSYAAFFSGLYFLRTPEVNANIHAHINTNTRKKTHTHMYIYIYIHTSMCIYIYISLSIHACMPYTSIYIWVVVKIMVPFWVP